MSWANEQELEAIEAEAVDCWGFAPRTVDNDLLYGFIRFRCAPQ